MRKKIPTGVHAARKDQAMSELSLHNLLTEQAATFHQGLLALDDLHFKESEAARGKRFARKLTASGSLRVPPAQA